MMSIDELYAIYLQHPVVTTDSRKVPKDSLFISLKGDRFDGNQYAAGALSSGAAYVVVDDADVAKAIGSKALLVTDGLATLSALAQHHRRQLKMPVLAITGSNGKTTTKELIAEVMSQRYRIHATQGNYNNHIGVPLTLLQIGPSIEMAIIEMGANHQEEIAHLCSIAEPSHGLINNIGEAHLEGFGGIEGVKKGKGELYDFLEQHKGVAFVNLDEDYLSVLAANRMPRIDYQSSQSPDPQVVPIEIQLLATSPNVSVAFLDEHHQIVEAVSHLPGVHNFENIKAAIAVGKYFKIKGQNIKKAIESYCPNNNRSERRQVNNIDFWLDAYNANPSSVSASLTAFAAENFQKKAVVLGDMLELGDASAAAHERIGRLATSLPIQQVILVGPAYSHTADKLGVPHFLNVSTLKDWFWQQNWSDTTVLLKGSRGIGLEGLLEI